MNTGFAGWPEYAQYLSMFTGDDILWWLSDLWHDITHPGDADMLALVLKLFALVVVALLLRSFLRVMLRMIWELVGPVLNGLWLIASAPVRIPRRWVKDWVTGIEQRRSQRAWADRQAQQKAEIKAQQAAEAERQEREQQAELLRLQGMLSKLE